MQVGARDPHQQEVGISDEARQCRDPQPLPHRNDLRFAVRGPDWNPRGADLALAGPVRDAMSAYDDPSDGISRTRAPRGQAIAGQLRQSIVDTNTPPLSPVTLMLRKMQTDNPDLKVGGKTVGEAAQRVAAGESYGGVSTKPLVWTGVLLNSVDYKVESGS